MATGIKISIPTPCHEGWDSMTPADRGRFCAACRKTVVDFTKSSDREIVAAYNKEAGLCGRFRASQLDRDLVIPKEKGSLWAGAAAAVALLALGADEAVAQTPTQTEQHEIMGKMRLPDTRKHTISGTVLDENQQPMPGVKVLLKPYNTDHAKITDIDGNFTFTEVTGDSLLFEYEGYELKEVAVNGANSYNIQMQPKPIEEIIVMGYRNGFPATTKKTTPIQPQRTFFGRIFHAIGTIFR